MRKTFAILASAGLVFAGCTQDLTPTPPQIEDEVTTETAPRNIENAVYNELTGSWMIPQNDPYTLDNFQQAYDNIAAGKSVQTLTRAEAAEFSEGEKLEPTHFALRIYPRNEDEQWKVEMMEDVNVVYSPFNYSGLTEEEAAQVPQIRAEIASPFEVSPYTVTYDYTESTDGGPTGPVTYQLPVLYAVWPASKPLPEDLEYKVDYGVFLPHEASDSQLSDEAISILERDALAAAMDISAQTLERTSTRATVGPKVLSGSVYHGTIPMANFFVQVKNGSFVSSTSTDSSGHFSLIMWNPVTDQSGLVNVTLDFSYRDPQGKWIITKQKKNSYDALTTIPGFATQSVLLNATQTVWSVPITLSPDDHQMNTIHRALDYFYNVQNYFVRHTPVTGPNTTGPTIVAALDGQQDPKYYPGGFIFMYGENMGKIFHELGHLIHHAHLLSMGSTSYDSTLLALHESFAPYVCWYLEQEYYKSIGDPKSVTLSANQYWTKTSDPYTPLFIDLTDDFDQSTQYAGSPNDQIKGVPPGGVWNIITSSTNWAQCRSKLQSYVGVYYTQAQFDDYIADFDYWFTYSSWKNTL